MRKEDLMNGFCLDLCTFYRKRATPTSDTFNYLLFAVKHMLIMLGDGIQDGASQVVMRF